MSRHPLKIVIAGAGIGGLAAAACLKAAGFEVELYERARELRAVGSALSLMPNALTALERVGVRPDLTRAQAFDSLRFLTRRGRPIRAIDFGGLARQLGQPSLAIHRASLQQALLEQARDCRIELGVSATGYLRHADGEGVTVLCSDGREVHADVLIGADGFNSAIRATMTGPERPTDWHYVIWRATPAFRHPKVTPGYVAHYWGRGQRFGLADIGEGNVYWWGTRNMPAEQAKDWRGGKAGIQRLYAGWADEVQAVIEATPEADISSLPAQDRPFPGALGRRPGDPARRCRASDADQPRPGRRHRHRRRRGAGPLPGHHRRPASRPARLREPPSRPRQGDGRDLAGAEPHRAVGASAAHRRPRSLLPLRSGANLRPAERTGTDLPRSRMMAEIRRPLSAVERWYWLSDQFSALNVISRVRVHGQLSIDDLRRGLDALQARHPLLRARIEHDAGLDPRWLPCERPIPLREVRGGGEEQWLREINERELPERIDPDSGPLIRTVAIATDAGAHDLLVVVPHIIADGTTVLTLAEQWLTLAADPAAQPWTASALPPAEDLRPRRFTGDEGAARLAEQTAQDEALVGRHRPGRIEPSNPVPLEARRTRLLHRELDGAQLEQLQRRAREHGTTVHGALTAALAIAAGHDHQRRPSHIAIGSPIDFRDELEPPVRPDEVGTYVATVPVVLDIARPFWEVARALTDDLGERRRQGHHFNLVTLVASAAPRCMADARPFMAFMEAEGPINLCSSNIGRYPFPERIGALRLSDAQFLTGISVNGYFVAAINSSHGRLFWNFTYIDEAVPGERAERLAEDCLGTLLSAIHAPQRSALEEQ